MADHEYRELQWRHRYDPHIAPINRFIDDLGRLDDAGHPPYIAPTYKGVACPGLVVLRDPGPKAGGDKGSGFLSVQNDDETAERQFRFMAESGVDFSDMLPWNAYPWYINAKPNAHQIREGCGPLKRVLDMLPRLQVILLLGGDARQAWKVFESEHPRYLAGRDVKVRSTYHTSRQALFHPDTAVRAAREQDIRDAFSYAASIIGS